LALQQEGPSLGDNTCTRLVAPPGLLEIRNDFIIRDSGQPDAVVPDAQQWDVSALPDEALMYLLGSRYCDTQKLSDLAWSLFGGIEGGWQRVQAICDYVHNHIEFGYHHARCDRTASEGHAERIGVCRDFAHLAVTLCRCMNIPARYCTGYLGDIGVPRDPAPMDFSAWFEVFLDGRWFTFDARHTRKCCRPRGGRKPRRSTCIQVAAGVLVSHPRNVSSARGRPPPKRLVTIPLPADRRRSAFRFSISEAMTAQCSAPDLCKPKLHI
jgi:transglutaminase-like putative cysteine protease